MISRANVNSRCSFFQWAEFDDDGNPPWSAEFKKLKGRDNDETDVLNGGSDGNGKLRGGLVEPDDDKVSTTFEKARRDVK